TRSKRDWSSDVCSSDLVQAGLHSSTQHMTHEKELSRRVGRCAYNSGQRAFTHTHTHTDTLLYSFTLSGANPSTPSRSWSELPARSEERRVGKEGRSRRC